MRWITIIAAALLTAHGAAASSFADRLVGRWRSENAPVGYWVVDRYSDGRLAKKEYVQFDYAKPAEINVTWGCWKVRGQTYSEWFEGTTSEYYRAWLGKWWPVEIQRVSLQRFDHLSGDGHDTYEVRFSDHRPLLKIILPPPRDYRWGRMLDTVGRGRKAVPDWVNGLPDAGNVELSRR